MKRIAKALLLMGTLLLPACTKQQTPTIQDIAGEWNIVKANGVDATAGEERAFITFNENGEMNGCTSVNNFFGKYTLTDGMLTIENVGMTRRMGTSMDVEEAVTNALNATATIEVKDSIANILNGEGEVVMTLKK